MNACHATALALVGWYLVVPPVHSSKGDAYVDWRASYSEWYVVRFFNHEEDCRIAVRTAERDAWRGSLTLIPDKLRASPAQDDPKPWLDQQADAECIVSDNPHLKSDDATRTSKDAIQGLIR